MQSDMYTVQLLPSEPSCSTLFRDRSVVIWSLPALSAVLGSAASGPTPWLFEDVGFIMIQIW